MLIAFIVLFLVAGIIALTLMPIILYYVYKYEETKRDKIAGEIIERNIDNGYGEIYEQFEKEKSEARNFFNRLRKKGYDV